MYMLDAITDYLSVISNNLHTGIPYNSLNDSLSDIYKHLLLTSCTALLHYIDVYVGRFISLV